MAVEESEKVVDGGLPSQLWAWLNPHATVDGREQLASEMVDGAGEIADWLPLVLAAGFVVADAAATLAGRGDLISFVMRTAGL
jgi:hypothetical protein